MSNKEIKLVAKIKSQREPQPHSFTGESTEHLEELNDNSSQIL